MNAQAAISLLDLVISRRSPQWHDYKHFHEAEHAQNVTKTLQLGNILQKLYLCVMATLNFKVGWQTNLVILVKRVVLKDKIVLGTV